MRHIVGLPAEVVMRKILPLVALCACSDDALVVLDNEPEVSIISPYDGQQFDEGEVVALTGVVDDDTSAEELLVEWISSIDGVLPDSDPPDANGDVEFLTASLSLGIHVITLRATDTDNEQGEDSVTTEILEVSELPSIEIVHPAEGEAGLEDYPYVFMATVADRQDPPEDLTVSLASDPGGFVCYMDIDGEGNSQCSATLPIATYMLSFTVEDTQGNSAQALAEFQVLSADDYDFDGDGYSVNGGDCNDSNDTIYPGAPRSATGWTTTATRSPGSTWAPSATTTTATATAKCPPA